MRNRFSGLVAPVLWLPAKETRFLRRADCLTAGKIPGCCGGGINPPCGARSAGGHSHAKRGDEGNLSSGSEKSLAKQPHCPLPGRGRGGSVKASMATRPMERLVFCGRFDPPRRSAELTPMPSGHPSLGGDGVDRAQVPRLLETGFLGWWHQSFAYQQKKPGFCGRQIA